MFKKLIRLIWGLILIPLTLSTLYHLPGSIFKLNSHHNSWITLFLGAVFYIFFEVLFNRPMRTYVFGHELTHALASMAMGGRVSSFKVSKKGGSVSVSKTNFFVALAPYCIPIYTLFVLMMYFLFRTFYPFEQLHRVFLALIGFSLAFHGSLTLFAVRKEQPDIRNTGFFFSLVFILLVNGWVLACLAQLLFWDDFSLKAFFWDTMRTQILIWIWLAVHLKEWLQWISLKIKPV